MFELIDNLAAFILQHNPYFDKVFANVSIDEKLGLVANFDEIVFPSQSHGDFFYLRYNGPVVLANNASSQMQECTFAGSFQIPLVLVASVKEADSDILFTNLYTTLANYKNKGLQAIRFANTSEEMLEIVSQELQVMKEADQRAALKRLPDATLVSIRFIMVSDIHTQPLTCIQNPCTTCS
jgi:hypothetical protein